MASRIKEAMRANVASCVVRDRQGWLQLTSDRYRGPMFGRLMVMERDLSNRAVGGSLGYGHHYRYISYGRHYRYISHSFSSHSCSCFVYSSSTYTFISRMLVDRIGVAIDD